MSATRPLFGTGEMYEALARRVNDDPEWLARAGHMNFTMAHAYGHRSCSFRFDGGRLVDVTEHDGPAAADFVLTAPRETWEQAVTGQLDVKRAIVTKQIQAGGDMLTLLKHVVVLKHLVRYLGELDLRFAAHAAA